VIPWTVRRMAPKRDDSELVATRKRRLDLGRVGRRADWYSLSIFLELFVDGYGRVRMNDAAEFKQLRVAERHFHSRSAGTITQDVERARVQLEANGLPCIAFDYPGYDLLAREDRCGRVISTMQNLPDAIREIFAAPETFRQNAFRAFARYYDFAANYQRISEKIGQLLDRPEQNPERGE
jgi:glycosyltransferase involved in cell wall biosynthesis